MMKKIEKYFARLFTAFSIMLNVIAGGKSNQTVSARQYERKRRGKFNAVYVIDRFFFWERDHCLESWVKWEIISYAIKKYDTAGVISRDEIQ